jgi:ParB-like chromosome segregation protein Spo0J
MTKIAGFGRKDIQVADPALLRIVGGAKLLRGDERSDADTADDPTHALWDGDRLSQPLSEEFIANVDHYGVHTPIEIVKIDDTITVVTGRRRVRAARVVNARRAKRGEPAISVDCVVRRPSNDGVMLEWLVIENEQRSGNELLAKIAYLKRLLERGLSEEHAARTFGVSTSTLKGWLAFEDNATKEVRSAVVSGRVSPSAAAELARVKEPAKQNEALTKLLSAPEKQRGTVAARRAVKKSTKGADADVGITSRRELKQLLDAVVNKSHNPNTSSGTLGWWEGVEDALKIILGEEAEPRLAGLLTKIREGE